VAKEQILAEFDPRLSHAQIAAVSHQEPISEFAADQVAEDSPDDRRQRRRQDDGGDIEIVFGARIDRCREKRGLAGQRKADAFQADNGRYRQKAVSMDQMLKKMHEGGRA